MLTKTHTDAWLAEPSLGQPVAVYEPEPRKRSVRVDKDRKHRRPEDIPAHRKRTQREAAPACHV